MSAPDPTPPAAGEDVPDAVFVYGTLLPGHVRWHLVEPFVAQQRPATVVGRLYDTGRRYPAARFDEPDEVHGSVLDLRPSRAAAALEVLDLVEGHEYARVEVTASDGTRCWSYEWRGPRDRLVPLPGGRWQGE